MILELTNPERVLSLNLGESIPKLKGNIDLSSFPNLSTFLGNNNDIQNIKISNIDNLRYFDVYGNLLTVFPDINAHPYMNYFVCRDNLIEGKIPELSGNLFIERFYCHSNLLTGEIPDTTLNQRLTGFYCYNNNLSGFIPNLNTNIKHFKCFNNPQITGEIPVLSSYTDLMVFDCYSCNLTGSIPDLSKNVLLEQFKCFENSLSGDIPDLSNNIKLEMFHCQQNSLTGFNSTSLTTKLTGFIANQNKLVENAVNSILRQLAATASINGTVNLLGPENSYPTGQGLIDVETLTSRGWEVLVNDTPP